jgi:hypothetical protein
MNMILLFVVIVVVVALVLYEVINWWDGRP